LLVPAWSRRRHAPQYRPHLTRQALQVNVECVVFCVARFGKCCFCRRIPLPFDSPWGYFSSERLTARWAVLRFGGPLLLARCSKLFSMQHAVAPTYHLFC